MPPKSVSTELINFFFGAGAKVFRAPDGEPYARVPIGNPTMRVFSLRDANFKAWLAREGFINLKKGISGSTISDVVTTLVGSADTKAVTPVYARVAGFDDRVYIDLGDAERRVLEINEGGWRVGVCPDDIYFVTREGMLPLAEPVEGGDLCRDLAEMFRLEPGGRDLMMLAAWMVACVRGKKPYPILVLSGEQGSGKSFACGLVRSCLDPNSANMSGKPKEPRDLLITARNSHVIGFDNLSFIDDWLSDLLCSLATGAGFRTRTLHTDANETIFSAARPVMINSILQIVQRPDLMDRSLVIEIPPLSRKARKTETDLNRRFDTIRPRILGALATAVSLAIRSPVTLPELPRLADFAATVESAAPALGWKAGEFMEVYDAVQEDSAAVLLEGNIVWHAMERMAREDAGEEWRGTTDQLRDRLAGLVSQSRQEDFPKTPRKLTNELRRLVPSLRTVGVEVVMPRGVQKVEGRAQRLMTVSYPKGQARLRFGPTDEPKEPEPDLGL